MKHGLLYETVHYPIMPVIALLLLLAMVFVGDRGPRVRMRSGGDGGGAWRLALGESALLIYLVWIFSHLPGQGPP